MYVARTEIEKRLHLVTTAAKVGSCGYNNYEENQSRLKKYFSVSGVK